MMLVHFRSDATVNGEGFSATFGQIDGKIDWAILARFDQLVWTNAQKFGVTSFA